MDKLIIASGNEGKVKEIKSILQPFYREILSMKDIGLKMDIVEDGETFRENAVKKAKEVMNAAGATVLADDSGLEVVALGGRPGVFSARFAGDNATDAENNEKLLSLLKDIPESERQACFKCCMALVYPQGNVLTTEGVCWGKIGFGPKGNQGFGYDPLFIVPEYGQTFGELSPTIKNQISHRAKALKKLQQLLEEKQFMSKK